MAKTKSSTGHVVHLRNENRTARCGGWASRSTLTTEDVTCKRCLEALAKAGRDELRAVAADLTAKVKALDAVGAKPTIVRGARCEVRHLDGRRCGDTSDTPHWLPGPGLALADGHDRGCVQPPAVAIDADEKAELKAIRDSQPPFNSLQRPRIVEDTPGRWLVCHPMNDAILGYYDSEAEACAAVALHEGAKGLLAALDRASALLNHGGPFATGFCSVTECCGGCELAIVRAAIAKASGK